MKETKIAKKNIIFLLEREKDKNSVMVCEEHKQTCQRWLGWLNELIDWIDMNKETNDLYTELELKAKDLKNAIKVYEENGI